MKAGAGGSLLNEHVGLLGRVAMAILGDDARVGQALESVARDVGGRAPPEGQRPVVWLLAMVRAACARQLSRLPMRARTDAPPASEPPKTERIGAADALAARCLLAGLRPTEREAVVMSLVGRLDASEVATVCNTDLATAKSRIARGMEQMLRQQAEGEGGPR